MIQLNLGERMNKKEIISLTLGIIIFIICLLISIFFAFYLLIPKDKLNIEIKKYYMSASLDYFNDNNENEISIDDLIKKGYAKKQKKFEEYMCEYKTSNIYKENNILTLKLTCKNHTNNYKIVKMED